MKLMTIFKLFDKCVWYSQLWRIGYFRHKKDYIIITYHDINDNSVSEIQFQREIEFLRKHYKIVSLDGCIKNSNLDHQTVITFDDGYKDILNIMPILKDVPFHLFVTTGFIATNRPYIWQIINQLQIPETQKEELRKIERQYPTPEMLYRLKNKNFKIEDVKSNNNLDWEQIKMLKTAIIGSHTHNHFKILNPSEKEIKIELINPKNLIETKIGQKCEHFCYPYGTSKDFDLAGIWKIKYTGHETACTTISGFNNSKSDVYKLKRFGSNPKEPLSSFVARITGMSIMEWIKSVKN